MDDAIRERCSITPAELSELLESDLPGRYEIASLGTLQVCGKNRVGRLLMAHGAGAGHDSPFLMHLREALASQGVQSLALEFDYMRRIRVEGRRRPPPRIDQLVGEMARWCDIVSHSRIAPLWLGGKSMGGRVASLLAARDGATGLVLCGYPFHPPRKAQQTRLGHWPSITCPTLVLQGTRDPFGNREDVEGYALPSQAQVHFVEDGDHDWKPRKRSGYDQSMHIDTAARLIADYMAAHA